MEIFADMFNYQFMVRAITVGLSGVVVCLASWRKHGT